MAVGHAGDDHHTVSAGVSRDGDGAVIGRVSKLGLHDGRDVDER
jgi:hypothetical protein